MNKTFLILIIVFLSIVYLIHSGGLKLDTTPEREIMITDPVSNSGWFYEVSTNDCTFSNNLTGYTSYVSYEECSLNNIVSTPSQQELNDNQTTIVTKIEYKPIYVYPDELESITSQTVKVPSIFTSSGETKYIVLSSVFDNVKTWFNGWFS